MLSQHAAAAAHSQPRYDRERAQRGLGSTCILFVTLIAVLWCIYMWAQGRLSLSFRQLYRVGFLAGDSMAIAPRPDTCCIA